HRHRRAAGEQGGEAADRAHAARFVGDDGDAEPGVLRPLADEDAGKPGGAEEAQPAVEDGLPARCDEEPLGHAAQARPLAADEDAREHGQYRPTTRKKKPCVSRVRSASSSSEKWLKL